MDWHAEKNIIWRHKKHAVWWKWKRTTKADPCPICGKDRCQISSNDDEVVCNRASESTGGWISEGRSRDGRTHYTDTIRRQQIIEEANQKEESAKRTYGFKLAPLKVPTQIPARQKTDRKETKDWGEQSRLFQSAVTTQVDDLADELGLPANVLHEIGAGWRAGYEQITFPHKDDTGKVIGISTRKLVTGEKGSVKGTNVGLFYADNWDRSGPILLVEGQTDTAALLLFNLTAIGRPSNVGGVEYLASMLRDIPANRNIVVIGEEDEHVSKLGDEIFPGRTGAISSAERLANALNRQILIAFPPKEHKDIREYVSQHHEVSELLGAFQESAEIVRPRATAPTLDGRPTDLEDRTLEDYRNELENNIFSAMQTKGFSLDRSGTGAGKSWSVFLGFKKLPEKLQTLTTTPTHVLCQERAKEMIDWGFQTKDIGVIPQLSDENCRNFNAASQAQDAGFAIGQALCPACPFKTGCEYVRQCKKAKRAKHLVMPHERLARGDGQEWLRERDIVVVDEKPELGVAPQVQATIADIKEVAEFYRKLYSAAIPPPSTASLDDWDGSSWNDQRMEAANAAQICLETAERLIAEAAPIHKAGVHYLDCSAGHEPDWKTQKALFKIMSDNGIQQPPAEAVRLVGLIVSGATTSIAMTVCGKDKRTKLVTASAVVNLNGKSVLLLDGTGNADRLQDLLGGEVMDITPKGRIKQVHSLVQLPLPVAKRTSPAQVCRIITALMEMEPDKKFGIICHKSQADKIFSEGGLLPEYLRPNVAKFSYFGHGSDRGSNRWHKKCDRLIVIGAPRRPPQAIRAELAARGLDAANELDGQYGPCAWIGTTEAGEEKEFRGSAYANNDWRLAHSYLTTSDIQQAIGRARVTLETGIPCIVVCDEPLGIPIREIELTVRGSHEQKVFSALFKASADEWEKGGDKGSRPYKYLLGSDPLQHPNPWVEGNRPAIHFSAIHKAVGGDRGNCGDTLQRMVDAGVIHKPAHGWYSLGVPAVDNPAYIWAGAAEPTLSAVKEAISEHGGVAKRKQILTTTGMSVEAFKVIQDSPELSKVGRGEYCVTGLPFTNSDGQKEVRLIDDDGEPIRAIITETVTDWSKCVLVG